MAGLNKVLLIGYLGRVPELRKTTDGLMISSFPLATSEKWGDNVKTEWHKIICFGKLAEIAEKYLLKGSLIYLEGRLQSRKYEKDGLTRYITEIIASNFQFLDSKQNGSKQSQEQKTQDKKNYKSNSTDDIPF